MGLINRMLKAATGMSTLQRTIDRLLDEIEMRAAQGLDEFTVSFGVNDAGAMNSLDAVTPLVIDAIQDAGHAVLDASGGGWSPQMSLRVRPARRAPTALSDESISATAAHQSQAIDPDLAKLDRSLALARSQPEGNEGKQMSADEVRAAADWISNQYEAGELELAWRKRLAMGYGVTRDGVPDNVWFWLNALPALAALQLGYQDHPAVAMCAGLADQAQSSGNPSHRQAMDEINQHFFGA